jgi:hypothetical protein
MGIVKHVLVTFLVTAASVAVIARVPQIRKIVGL